ncbi:MAG: hypothetical protein AAB250_12445 [Bdellovibrionota bacterium]
MRMVIVSLLLLLLATPALASQGNQTISGFKFQTCLEGKCLEVAADRAWMAQLGFSFTTDGATTVVVRNGSDVKTFIGTNATLHERLKILVLDQADGTARMFSLDELKEVGMHL